MILFARSFLGCWSALAAIGSAQVGDYLWSYYFCGVVFVMFYLPSLLDDFDRVADKAETPLGIRPFAAMLLIGIFITLTWPIKWWILKYER